MNVRIKNPILVPRETLRVNANQVSIDMTKLHLGCGAKELPGYVHVDIKEHPHVEHRADITDDLTHLFPAGSVTEIYACHVLEHIGRQDVVTTLLNWRKLLSVGGTLRLAVPDFEAVVSVYQHDPASLHRSLLGLLHGGQRDEWDYHVMSYDFDRLRALLEQVGFTEVRRYDWQDFLPTDYDDYSRCYLPHLDFANGRLMSLNVVATKSENDPPLDDRTLLYAVTKSKTYQ